MRDTAPPDASGRHWDSEAAPIRLTSVGMTLAALLLAVAACQGAEETRERDTGVGPDLYRVQVLPNVVDGVVWESGDWEPHLRAGAEGVSWGNHRAVVELEVGSGEGRSTAEAQELEAVLVTIPWRRRDPDPASKGVIVVDATSGAVVPNSLALRIENASGDIVFRPNPGSTTYHVYYLPWQSTGGYYPTVTYPTPEELRASARGLTGAGRTESESVSRAQGVGGDDLSWEGLAPDPDPAWEAEARTAEAGTLPRARTTRIQSVDDFHSFFPMEVIATPEEAARFWLAVEGSESPGGDSPETAWALVPEHRDRPIRMRHFLPRHWAPGSGADVSTGTDADSGAASGAATSGMDGIRENVSAEPSGENDDGASRFEGLTRETAERSAGETPPKTSSNLAFDSPPGFRLFRSRVLRDEAFTFQLGIVSGPEPLEDVQVTFDGFPRPWLETLTCFNCEGIDEKGIAFGKRIDIPPETVQPLWIGVRVPADEAPGTVEGTVTVTSGNRGSRSVTVSLDVQDARAPNGGADEPELQTRLEWLNSTLGTDPDFIVEPFHPVVVEPASAGAGPALSVLGRRIELGPSGLPDQIFSFFTPELTHLTDQAEPILARPLSLAVTTPGGHVEGFRSSPFEVLQESRGRASWTAESTSDYFDMRVNGALEYDGMLDFRITLVALSDAAVDDIGIPVSLVPDAAEYMLGLGRKGGRRPEIVDWRWAVENHQEGVWLGGIHKGLQYVLRDENYVRPLNTNFYRNQPLNLPPSWFNGGLGGILIVEEEVEGLPAVTAYNYSGPRTVLAGDTLHFNIRFLVTPFKPIDTETHFNTRFVHQYVPVDSVRAWGGTVVNIHHANEINPYINYPFFNLDLQAAYIDEAHEKGVKVKLYNTIRELTYRARELFPLRSLGHEILNDGEGGGHSWLQEHLTDDYHSAWHAWRVDDAAVLNKGTSRWTNYYIEGVSWLAENQHIDGLYLDDIAFSRATVKRLVNVLHRHRPQVVIDLHSANQFNVRDGFINSAMLYMEHFPFISRLWFGEYFEYDLDEDYWMTEVSGLPFGLMGEMLQDGGHPYRGLLFGMTGRKYGDNDPRPEWAMMSAFGIAESEMKGYWLEDAPVVTDHPRILATTFLRPEGALIVLASWSEDDEVVSLLVDRDLLVPGQEISARAPAVEGLQPEQDVRLSAVPVPAGQGLFIVVRPRPGPS